jgi:hypothetical protein
MVLQLSLSTPIYNSLRYLQILQFPWRMLTLVVPIGIILVVAMLEALFRLVRGVAITYLTSVAWLVSFVALSPVFASFHDYAFVPTAALTAPPPISCTESFR